MANPHIPPKPGIISARDEGAIIAWGGIRPFPRDYTFKVYWAAGTFSSPPIPPLTLLYEEDLVATQSSIRAGFGDDVIPSNTAIYVAITSVSPSGEESNQSPLLFLSLNNAEQDHPIAVARDSSGQQKTLLVDEDGATAISAEALPLPAGASTEAKQDAEISLLTSIDAKLPDLGPQVKSDSISVTLATDEGPIATSDKFSSHLQTVFTLTTTPANLTGAGGALVTPLAGRKSVIIQNRSGGIIFLGDASGQEHRIINNDSAPFSGCSASVSIWGRTNAGSGAVVIWEFAE